MLLHSGSMPSTSVPDSENNAFALSEKIELYLEKVTAMKSVRVAAVQMHHEPGDISTNLATIERVAREAAEAQAKIIAFPECCLQGYWHLRNLSREELFSLAEPLPTGDHAASIRALSEELQATIGVGLIERDDQGRLFNSYFVAMPSGQFAVHRKLHVFVSPFLTPGDDYTVFDTPHGCRVGVLICYDNNLVENARCTALRGAEILLSPHQTGGCKSGSPCAMGPIDPALWDNREHDPAKITAEFQGDKGRGWLMRWLPARAHDNGMFLVFANGVGRDDDETRTGNAMILDCYGRLLAESKDLETDLVLADLDATLLERSTGQRWLKARRPELYSAIAERTSRERSTREVRFEYDAKELDNIPGERPAK